MKKRVAVFLFYDKDGIMREYIFFYLDALRKISDEVMLVSNGVVEERAVNRLAKMKIALFERENVGYDVWAYKEAFFQLGWDKLREYDELIICNYTCYGPVFPLVNMMAEMDKRACDFWGAAKHPEQPVYLLPNREGYIYEHIMSYFVVIRRRMLCSKEFEEYWGTVPEIKNKNESVALHETQFTKHFEDLGFVSDAYVDLDDYEGRCYNASIFLANEFLEKSKCPFVKRRAFFFPEYDGILQESDSHEATKILKYIGENTDYDCDLIWDDILSTQKMSSLINNMHLGNVARQCTEIPYRKIAVVIYVPEVAYCREIKKYIYDLRHIDYYFVYEAKQSYKIKSELKDIYNSHLVACSQLNKAVTYTIIRRLENVLTDYDYVSIIADHDIPKANLSIQEEDYIEYVCSCMLSVDSITTLIELFETDTRLGMVVPRATHFGRYYAYAQQRMVNGLRNYYKKQYNILELKVPYDDVLYTNGGGAFWFNRYSFGKLSAFLGKCDRKYDKSTLNYFVPMIIQASGKYTKTIITTEYANLLLDINQWNNRMLIEAVGQQKKIYPWDAKGIRAAALSVNGQIAQMQREDIMEVHFSFRELVTLITRYPFHRRQYKKKKREEYKSRWKKANVFVSGLFFEKGKIVAYIFAKSNLADNCYIKVGKKKIYPIKEMDREKIAISDYMVKYHCVVSLFFYIPICTDSISVEYYSRNMRQNLGWANGINYNALDIHETGLFPRICCDGKLKIESRGKYILSVLRESGYGIVDKMIFIAMLINPIHNIVLMGENYGACDNTFQVYKYAVNNNAKHVYYVCSDSIRRTEKNSLYRKHMVVHNSVKHHILLALTQKVVGSYSFQLELLPTTNVFKDIHLNMLNLKWYFVPHGMAVGDKDVAMLYHYSWGDPYITFTNSYPEQITYANVYGFHNVACLGSPRMDKWALVQCDNTEIIIFFTWRMEFSYKGTAGNISKLYIQKIVRLIKRIRMRYPDRRVSYVLHHEIIKAGLDSLLIDRLAGYVDEFISFSTKEGAERFNIAFASAKYLITDYSSVAFDFAYKKGAICIYYMPDDFIEGHYPLKEYFYDIQLGRIAKSDEEVLNQLDRYEPAEDELSRRKEFFYAMDDCNAKRVYGRIFEDDSRLSVHVLNPQKICKAEGGTEPRRLSIFMLWDPDGVVDKYVLFYLSEMKKVCDELCVVINGYINDIGISDLKNVANKVLCRENIGFDSWAYRYGLEYYGYEAIASEFDEVILSNYTCYGPIYSFEDMFEKMKMRTCDFWGHVRYIPFSGAKREGVEIPEHIQSHFIVFRKEIIASKSFRQYWISLKQPRNYSEAIEFHEFRCTAFFEKKGFLSDSYVKEYSYPLHGTNTPVFMAYDLLYKDHSPLIKRKVFYIEDGEFRFPLHTKETVYDVVNFIKNNTDYDVTMIYENILRTVKLADETSKGRIATIEKLTEKMENNGEEKYRIYMEKNRIYNKYMLEKAFRQEARS